MRSFKAKKEQRSAPFRDAIARIIAAKIDLLQREIVRFLQQCDRRSTIRQKKILLVVFCLVCGGYCGYLLGHTLFAKTAATVMRYAPISPVAQPPPLSALKPYRPKKNNK
jgi:hypothetical protein